MMWYLQNVTRFKSEQDGLRELEREAPWLRIAGWRMDSSLRLCMDAEIVLHRTFTITLRYGLNFPSTAPSVLPQTPERWSEHQYGSGELCLEYGPDNWIPELTGADMIRSAHRLLSGEAPRGTDLVLPVTSRHATTLGQDLRNIFARFLTTQTLTSMLASAPPGRTGKARFFTLYREKTYMVVPVEISGLGDEGWRDTEVPEAVSYFASTHEGLAFTLTQEITLPRFETGSELKHYLSEHGFAQPADYEPRSWELLLVSTGAGPRLLWIWRDESVHDIPVVPSNAGKRLDSDHIALSGKTVGLVGCGSAGSKIATMLARAGVRSFVLIDDDLFLPENLVRHELDWASIGEHKAEGLARRLALVAPGVKSIVRCQQLGGQESNGVTDWSLKILRDCDLIIDATANPKVFNLISGVVHEGEKPFVWMEVFAGGIGGLIARSRPNVDPAPQYIRAQVDAWCQQKGVAAPRPAHSYAVEADNSPLIATDADVGVIAAHAARFSIDILIGRSPSWFPVSVYLIGLAPAWIFEQPFQTFPIDVGGARTTPEPAPPDPADVQQIVQMIVENHDQAASTS